MPPIMIAGIVLIVVILIVALCLLGYVKAPPDQAYIISGFRKHRTLIGKAGVRIPVWNGWISCPWPSSPST